MKIIIYPSALFRIYSSKFLQYTLIYVSQKDLGNIWETYGGLSSGTFGLSLL